MNSFLTKIVVLYCIALLSSCGIYSFTGASISPEVKTVSVQYFPNRASTIQPTLSQVFTEKLKDYFIKQTNLNLINNGGDLDFNGQITKYEVKPIAILANESASQNRLTISVMVNFENTFDENKNFEQQFSRYSDYPSSESLSSVEDGLIEQISNELAEDIFNKAVVNW